MLTKVGSSDRPPVPDRLSASCSAVWLIAAWSLQKAGVYLCSSVRTAQITWDNFFFLCLMTSSLLVLMGDWKSMQQSPILQLLRAFSPAYKGEGDLQSSGCVAFLWWTPYTGFKLFCLGYWETEFIWQSQESGPHLIACDETRPRSQAETPLGAGEGAVLYSFVNAPVSFSLISMGLQDRCEQTSSSPPSQRYQWAGSARS